MTAYTDRADALGAAIRDIARDLEADLGKLTRYRGGSQPTAGVRFRDPGADITSYEKQKAEMPGRVEHTIASYEVAIAEARAGVSSPEPESAADRTRRLELVRLIDQIQSVTSHDDAAALVSTFEEA